MNDLAVHKYTNPLCSCIIHLLFKTCTIYTAISFSGDVYNNNKTINLRSQPLYVGVYSGPTIELLNNNNNAMKTFSQSPNAKRSTSDWHWPETLKSRVTVMYGLEITSPKSNQIMKDGWRKGQLLSTMTSWPNHASTMKLGLGCVWPCYSWCTLGSDVKRGIIQCIFHECLYIWWISLEFLHIESSKSDNRAISCIYINQLHLQFNVDGSFAAIDLLLQLI